jgi:hypothetical protein
MGESPSEDWYPLIRLFYMEWSVGHKPPRNFKATRRCANEEATLLEVALNSAPNAGLRSLSPRMPAIVPGNTVLNPNFDDDGNQLHVIVGCEFSATNWSLIALYQKCRVRPLGSNYFCLYSPALLAELCRSDDKDILFALAEVYQVCAAEHQIVRNPLNVVVSNLPTFGASSVRDY